MKFLAGLSKFISIFLLIADTVICTAVIITAGIIDGYIEAIWIMSAIWLGVVFVSLNILGTGIALSQIVKMKKRMEQLEQRLWTILSAPTAAPVSTSDETAASTTPTAAAPITAPAVEPEKKMPIWPFLVAGSGCIVLAAALILIIRPGVNTSTPSDSRSDSVIMPPINFSETEPATTEIIDVNEISMGSALNTDFVSMQFNDVVIQEDIRKSVTVGIATHTTGPAPIDGHQYICLSGTIVNTSNSELPVYDFFAGRFDLGSYSYTVSANDCDILNADGSPESKIVPLLEYEFRIYTEVPNQVAEMISAGEDASFTFGFYDGFENYELASNRAFSDDPIAECPYQYFIPFE